MTDPSMPDIPFVRSSPIAITLGIGVALAATIGWAQPTGNPKGTVAPTTQGESAKAPATRSMPIDSASKPAGAANPGQAEAVARTPGGGTAGGLTGRHPQGDSGDPKQNSTPRSIPQKK
jgi:hypothetical protein